MSETAPSTTAGTRPKDSRRVYYDHEPAYRKIAAQGGQGWDDLSPGQNEDSYEALRAFLQSPYAPTPGSVISALDLGCGGGQATILLAERGWNAFGMDYASTAVQLAQRNASAAGVTVHFLVGDCLSYPFAAEVMDLVLDNHVLHCLI